MLRKILTRLAAGGTVSTGGLALELGIVPTALEAMLARLAALGYVEELTAALAAACPDGELKSCAGCAGCGPFPKARVWSLTAHGRGAVTRSVLSPSV